MSAGTPTDDLSMTSVPVATLFEAALGRLSDVLTPGSFLEATPESLVVAETDGEIIYANAACERLTGFDRGRAPRAAGGGASRNRSRRSSDGLVVRVHVYAP